MRKLYKVYLNLVVTTFKGGKSTQLGLDFYTDLQAKAQSENFIYS